MFDLFLIPAGFHKANPRHWLAVGGGLGLMRMAPGTFGTLAGIPLALLVAQLPLVWGVLLLLAAALVGVWICGATARDWGVHDHGSIVWDEVVGYAAVLLGLPASPLYLLLAFVYFRFFDILKPWPIRWLDRELEGGLGIMIDDLVAGAAAAACLWATHLLLLS